MKNFEHWQTRAECTKHDPELFYPVGSSRRALIQAAEAKKVCAICPVKRECLDEAMSHNSSMQHGVWGGLTAEERIALIKRRANVLA